MTAKDSSQPGSAAEARRTPLENFLDGFPIDLAKRAVTANYGELFMGGDISAYVNVCGQRSTFGPPCFRSVSR